MADLENSEIGMKFSQGKPRWSLLPPDEIEEVVKVLTEGAKKYKDNNWQKVDPKEYLDALGRHINAYRKGEKYDVGVDCNGKAGDGYHHLAHAICNCLFIMWNDNQLNKADSIDEEQLWK